jgi:hypothetical protein
MGRWQHQSSFLVMYKTSSDLGLAKPTCSQEICAQKMIQTKEKSVREVVVELRYHYQINVQEHNLD